MKYRVIIEALDWSTTVDAESEEDAIRLARKEARRRLKESECSVSPVVSEPGRHIYMAPGESLRDVLARISDEVNQSTEDYVVHVSG